MRSARPPRDWARNELHCYPGGRLEDFPPQRRVPAVLTAKITNLGAGAAQAHRRRTGAAAVLLGADQYLPGVDEVKHRVGATPSRG